MGALEKGVSFRTETFDYTSDLPHKYNAGNRFYGRDAATFLCQQLNAEGFRADFMDEDWGWLILGRADPTTQFEIAIYNINGHGEGGRPGAPEWGLRIRAFQRMKVLGLIPKKVAVPVPSKVDEAVLNAIKALGASPTEWPVNSGSGRSRSGVD